MADESLPQVVDNLAHILGKQQDLPPDVPPCSAESCAAPSAGRATIRINGKCYRPELCVLHKQMVEDRKRWKCPHCRRGWGDCSGHNYVRVAEPKAKK